jgi:hypothetical protein
VNKDKLEGGKHFKYKIIHYALALVFILMVISFWTVGPMVSSAVRHELAEWERVHDEMLRDIGRLREEKREISDDIEILRIQRDVQRREWELEREDNEKRRRGHMPFWGEARLLTAQCPRDRFRRYEARMYNLLAEDDWFAACMKEPIKIAGQTLGAPRSCINHVRHLTNSDEHFVTFFQGLDHGVHGYWSIEVNTRECPRTIWDRVSQLSFTFVYYDKLIVSVAQLRNIFK